MGQSAGPLLLRRFAGTLNQGCSPPFITLIASLGVSVRNWSIDVTVVRCSADVRAKCVHVCSCVRACLFACARLVIPILRFMGDKK